MLNPILVAVPIFLLGMLIEAWISQRKQLKVYRWNDTMTNLHLGTGQVLISALIKAPLLVVYSMLSVWTVENTFVSSWDVTSAWAWVLGFVIVDLCYYFFHRYSHEINFLWAAHVVHHQSEEYNLSVALRQSWIQQIFSGIFYLPLALIGLPVEMFFLLNALNTLYQFWIHTRLINTIGPLEWLINTPAHHRVHHGVDDHYVDKNYAGVFIIWDRMFGTFIQEEERPRYGVIKPLRSWNPAWANFDIWHLMWSRVQSKTLTLGERLSVPFRTPAWRGALEAPPNMILRTDDRYTLYDHRSSYMRYIIVLGGINVGTSMWVVSQSTTTSLQEVLIWVGAHLFAGISLHALLEERSWGLWVERLRLLLLPVLAYCIPLNTTPLSSTLSSLSIECSLYTFMSICSLIILAQRPPPQLQSSSHM